jgi:hypothetical protein
MTDNAHYRPTNADLLRTVSDFLSGIGPRLGAGDRYSALVCSHILDMLAREAAGPALPPMDEAQLAANIRAGHFDREESWNEIMETILQRTIARVRMVKPDHLADMHQR